MELDVNDATVPEYDLSEFSPDESEDDGLAEQMAGEQLSRIQERKANFNNFDSDGNNVLDALRTPLSASDLVDTIKRAHFLAQTERALINLVQTFISTDTLLANIENMDYANNLYATEIDVIRLTTPKTDTGRAEWSYILGCMDASVKLILTRTHGAYRERRLQDMNRAEVVTGKLSQTKEPGKHSFSLPKIGK